MLRTRLFVILGFFVAGPPPASPASLEHAKIALHAQPQVSRKGLCLPTSEGGEAPEGPCSDLVTRARSATLTTLYLVAAQADSGQGFSAVSVGVQYSPSLLGRVPFVSWYGCASATSFDGPLGPWPNPSSGATLTWNACETQPPPGYAYEGAFAVAGAIDLYAYADGWVEIVEHPAEGPALKAFDCTGTETVLPLTHAGKVRFSASGADPGYNPCSESTAPTCLASPPSVDFGTVYIPETRDTTITIRNTGEAVVQGSVSIQTVPSYSRFSEFHLTSPGPGYRLDPGEEMNVTIRYEPKAGTSRAVLHLGEECPGVGLFGTGILGIEVEPTRIEFGLVSPDSVHVDTFQVKNVSPVRLAFERLTSAYGHDLDCPGFVLPGMQFDLLPGEVATRVAMFKSVTAGVYECTVYLGSTSLSFSLAAEVGGACSIEPPEIDFGSMWIDETVDTTFVVRNRGSSTLTGSWSGHEGAFKITTSGYIFTIAPGDSLTVGLRFEPYEAREFEDELTFASCSVVRLRGIGLNPCRITPSSLNFGPVPAGSRASLPFYVQNESDRVLEGRIQLGSPPSGIDGDPRFTIEEGAGPFELKPGGILSGRVAFQSDLPNRAIGYLETGLGCGGIDLSANEGLMPAPSSARLPLHVVPHGTGVCPPHREQADPRQLPCSEYVTRGASQNGAGYDLYLLAAELERPAALGVDFGIAYDGALHHGIDVFGWTSCSELQFQSDGWPASGTGNLLTWNHTTVCTEDDISTESYRAVLGVFYVYAYSADVFRITPRTFAPIPGPHFMDCSLVETYIGPQGCGSAVFTPGGTLAGCNPCLGPCAEQGVWCSILPAFLDFGAVPVGEYADTVISVINTSPMVLNGVPVLSGPFSLPEEGSQITLQPGAVHDLRLRFAPTRAGRDSTRLALGASCPPVALAGMGLTPAGTPQLATRATWLAPSHKAEIRISGVAWDQSGRADIRIFDVQGRLMHRAKLEGASPAGTYVWAAQLQNGRRAAAGLYYVQVKVLARAASTSFVLLP